MANVARYMKGETNPVECNVRAASDIEIGDLLFMEREDGFARPASEVADLGSLTANQQYFAFRFLGVAAQRHRASHDPADYALRARLAHWFGGRERAAELFAAAGYDPETLIADAAGVDCPYGIDVVRKARLATAKLTDQSARWV